MDNLQTWMLREIEKRGWVHAELARRAKVSPSHVSRVLSGEAAPGLELVVGLSKALGVSTDDICRMAGLLSPAVRDPGPVYHVGNNLDERLARALGRLGVADQELVVMLAERLAGLVEGRIIGEEGE
jgi:transcriptional regulator with XRE-family HTH domain